MTIDKITPENYKVPKGEERSYHCIIECVQYDQKTGKKLSVPRIQKFGKKMFEAHVYSSLKKQGYTVTILHNPTEWLKQQEAESKKKAEEKAAAEKQAQDEAFQKAVAEEVARQMAALNIPATNGQEHNENKTLSATNKVGRPKKQV